MTDLRATEVEILSSVPGFGGQLKLVRLSIQCMGPPEFIAIAHLASTEQVNVVPELLDLVYGICTLEKALSRSVVEELSLKLAVSGTSIHCALVLDETEKFVAI